MFPITANHFPDFLPFRQQLVSVNFFENLYARKLKFVELKDDPSKSTFSQLYFCYLVW